MRRILPLAALTALALLTGCDEESVAPSGPISFGSSPCTSDSTTTIDSTSVDSTGTPGNCGSGGGTSFFGAAYHARSMIPAAN